MSVPVIIAVAMNIAVAMVPSVAGGVRAVFIIVRFFDRSEENAADKPKHVPRTEHDTGDGDNRDRLQAQSPGASRFHKSALEHANQDHEFAREAI
jgi:hypothetical protein